MTGAVLSRRRLNRALLARQLLTRRAPVAPWDAIEWLAGLPARESRAPYVALWSRLEGFHREKLSFAVEERRVVRATLMRGEAHLVTAADYRLWWRALQPAPPPAYERTGARGAPPIDSPRLVAAAREFLSGEPRPVAELGAFLRLVEPAAEESRLLEAVQAYLPIVQVPPCGLWDVEERPVYALADEWLGSAFAPPAEGLGHLIVRFLGAFGPASVPEIEAWSGRVGLDDVVTALRPGLQVFRDEAGHTLYDLPEAARPDDEIEVLPRFLPANDALLHAGRQHVLPSRHRHRLMQDDGWTLPAVLLDGEVGGTWEIERSGVSAVLWVMQFARISSALEAALRDEGEALLRFVADDAERFDVRLTSPFDA